MIYLIAGNGTPNFGDELIVASWLRFYREHGYNGHICVDGRGSHPTKKLLKKYENVEFLSNNIPRHRAGLEGSYAFFFTKGVDFARKNVDRFRGVRAFHFLGGGYTGAHWRNVMRLLGAATELGSILNVPVVATGVGFEPFVELSAEDRHAWKFVIERFAFLECRDEVSFRSLLGINERAGWGLSFGLDDAYLYPPDTTRHDGKWLHLSGFSEEGIFGKDGRAILPGLADSFDRVKFWVCSKADALVYDELQKIFSFIEPITNHELINDGLPISKDDFMLTGRFHPHLLAARVGISGYYFSGSAYYRGKHGLVSSLGSRFRNGKNQKICVFSAVEAKMTAAEEGRVETKQSVARRVVALLNL